jgi:hypothetical protein
MFEYATLIFSYLAALGHLAALGRRVLAARLHASRRMARS